LAVLLSVSPTSIIKPLLTNNEANQPGVGQQNLNDLIRIAEENRYDLKGYRDVAKQEQQNLTLQKRWLCLI